MAAGLSLFARFKGGSNNSFRVAADNGPEETSSDDLEEELFADTTSNQKRRRHIIASQTVVSIECKQLGFLAILLFSPVQSGFYLNLLTQTCLVCLTFSLREIQEKATV